MVGDKQREVTKILESVLGVQATPNKSFFWLNNKHTQEDFKLYFPIIDEIFRELGGDTESNKLTRKLNCDAYFGQPYNFIFEFDEYQHFSTARLKTLLHYPKDLKLSFDVEEYKGYCQKYRTDADKYRHSKTTTDFAHKGGRTSQRAYLDCFKDMLPSLHGLNPTVRIAEFEVTELTNNQLENQSLIRKILKTKGVFVNN